jgi:hypothetical protein
MNADRAARHKKFREEIAELKDIVISDLEHRGYAVRGKTPNQIRKLLKGRPPKQKAQTPAKPN